MTMIPLSKPGESCDILDTLAEGVEGYAIESNGEVFIPVVVSKNPGTGAVGRFLDSVPPNVVFPNVISEQFRGMLIRRGFVPRTDFDDMFKCDVTVWVRP